jgi:hypothetical protein
MSLKNREFLIWIEREGEREISFPLPPNYNKKPVRLHFYKKKFNPKCLLYWGNVIGVM